MMQRMKKKVKMTFKLILYPCLFENVQCCSDMLCCWDACNDAPYILGKVENSFTLLGVDMQ